jgi:hypothetical protein
MKVINQGRDPRRSKRNFVGGNWLHVSALLSRAGKVCSYRDGRFLYWRRATRSHEVSDMLSTSDEKDSELGSCVHPPAHEKIRDPFLLLPANKESLYIP